MFVLRHRIHNIVFCIVFEKRCRSIPHGERIAAYKDFQLHATSVKLAQRSISVPGQSSQYLGDG